MRSCWAIRCSSPAPCRSAPTRLPVLVESHEGRPTKIEGNPEHPAGLGGSDVFMQASILDMYDPDRSQIITYLGEIRNWSDYIVALRGALNGQRAIKGAGLRILSAPTSSPTMASLMEQVQAAYPRIEVDAVGAGQSRQRARRIACWRSGSTSRRATTWRRPTSFFRSTAIFFPAAFPDFCITRAQFAARRNPDLKEKMSRFYSMQSTPTNTSGKADHRLPVRASEVESDWREPSLPELGAGGGSSAALKPEHQKFVAAVVKDLQAHKGAVVVIPGDNQPPAVHALAHAMNGALGANGNTVVFTDPVAGEAARPDCGAEGTGRRDERGQGRHAAGHGQQSGVRRAGRFRFRRRDGQGSDCACSTTSMSGRNRRSRATGTSTPRIIWSSGAMSAPSTARCR